ncbi:MAG: leucine-rich repeat domain-containing protein [Salinivirgaceae bacterium]|nr:leucine-rich repeat domain-containing protein [Salinivirgaceae bacterium]
MILMSARNKNITSCTVSADCRFICDGAFRDCKKLAEVTLPESLTYVNNGLFSGCSSLRSVAIPESVTAIGDESFKGCSSLTEIKIPESVTTIGSSAFAGCSGLTALTIPDRVTSVSNNAFDGCTGLESVVIGKSVAEFSSGIFANCSGLNSIICYAETPIRLEDDPFEFNDTIYVPAASVSAYKAAAIWKRKEITPFYKVKILSANEALGTAEGDTLILGDHKATLTTTPAEGYHFVRWSDNNTESPRKFVATKDTVLTAYFEAHTTVTDRAVAVTCEAFGLTEGSHCPGCGHVFVKQDTLPATGHTEVVDAAVPVTCTTAGKTEGKHCSVCNATLVAQEVITATGHQVVVDLAVPATCTVTGWTDGKHCSVCNTVLVAQKEVPAFGHEFGAYVYNNDATTESDGTETALCKHGCGASVSRVALGTKLAETPGEGPSTAVEESAADAVSIYAHHNVIVVENADAEIRVYDAMGRLICRDATPCVRTELQVNAAGIYIVRVGSVAKRVMVND